MKKYLKATALVLALAATAISCGEDTVEPVDENILVPKTDSLEITETLIGIDSVSVLPDTTQADELELSTKID